MSDNPMPALPAGIAPQKDGSFAISIEIPNGVATPELLELASRIAKNYKVIAHITTAQKLMFLGFNATTAMEALALLDEAGASVRKARDLSQPRTCVGLPFCKLALQETFSIGNYLFNRLARKKIPPKLKVAIAGCPACCTWANMIDLGFVGVKSGYNVFVGGHGGARPKHGVELGKIVTFEQAGDVLERLADIFSEEIAAGPMPKGRVSRVLKKLGEEEMKIRLGLDSGE